MYRFLIAVAVLGVLAPAPAPAAVPVPGREPIETVDFERHVMGLFSKAGCNNGSCHGSFQGKGGFRLSLFGYDPAKDFNTLTRDLMARRINAVEPDKSLLLLKAAGRVPHEGGVRMTPDSWQFAVLRSWVVSGAKWRPGSGAVTGLKIEPLAKNLTPPAPLPDAERGEEALVFSPPSPVGKRAGGLGYSDIRLRVTAQFADGSAEDVTAFCDFRVQDDSVAEINSLGSVTAQRPGDTGLVVSYRGVVQAIRVLVPATVAPGFEYPNVPAANFVDREVTAKLRLLNMTPSGSTTDAEFLRRITIDTIGSLPSPDEVRAFLADPSPDKRDRKIDELLANPLHAALWATKFSDVTGNNTDTLELPNQAKPRRSQMWHDWLRKRFQDNVPYDQIVHDILTATSREGLPASEWIERQKNLDEELDAGWESHYADRRTLDLFWRRQQNVPLEQWGEKVAAAFLGVRLECAQCHKHPTDRWTQIDYRSFANIFQQVSLGASPETKASLTEINAARLTADKKKNQINTMRELYLGGGDVVGPGKGGRGNNRAFRHPDTNKPLAAKALGGPEIPVQSGKDAREKLWEWMRSPKNPTFARAFVNRVWAHYFGIGLIDPVDDFSQANPPTNARLLAELAEDFIAHDYNVRHLECAILQSHTYQRSSTPNESNKYDKNNFARGYLRPMMAEVVVDVLDAATGVEEQWGNDAPKGRRMIEVGASRLNNGSLGYALRIFGRPARTSACDCERTLDPALPQTLYRMTDQAVLQKLTAKDNRLAHLLKAKKSDEEILDDLFLACLTRLPTDDERAAFVQHHREMKTRPAAFQDTLWALINTREFILNH
jgi:hypothetical protein